MNILLTGSSSFVGRYLSPLLNKIPGQLWHLLRESKGLDHEILWDFKSELPLNIPKFDVIVHLAAKVCFGTDLDLEQYIVNTIATGALASLAKKNRALFIFTSTAIVHGNVVLMGELTPLKPQSHYAMTKVLAEEIIKQWTEDYFFLRIGGIYGLDGPEHLGLNCSINKAYYNKTIPLLKGSGQARRNYICVQDVARWVFALVQEKAEGICRHDRILYLAGPEILPIQNYLTSVARILSDSHGPIIEDGTESRDCILEATQAPFQLTTFEEYLRSLKKKRDNND